jgi:hypothetical protein
LNPAEILGIFYIIQHLPAEKNEVFSISACLFRKTVRYGNSNTIPEPTYLGEIPVA